VILAIEGGFSPQLSGRDGEIRTHDFLLPKQALYQAELRPEWQSQAVVANGRQYWRVQIILQEERQIFCATKSLDQETRADVLRDMNP
jgi:hypothetical protein